MNGLWLLGWLVLIINACFLADLLGESRHARKQAHAERRRYERAQERKQYLAEMREYHQKHPRLVRTWEEEKNR